MFFPYYGFFSFLLFCGDLLDMSHIFYHFIFPIYMYFLLGYLFSYVYLFPILCISMACLLPLLVFFSQVTRQYFVRRTGLSTLESARYKIKDIRNTKSLNFALTQNGFVFSQSFSFDVENISKKRLYQM